MLVHMASAPLTVAGFGLGLSSCPHCPLEVGGGRESAWGEVSSPFGERHVDTVVWSWSH